MALHFQNVSQTPLILIDEIFTQKIKNVSPRNPKTTRRNSPRKVANIPPPPKQVDNTSQFFTQPSVNSFGYDGFYPSSPNSSMYLNNILSKYDLRLREIFKNSNIVIFSCFNSIGLYCYFFLDNELISVDGEERICIRSCEIKPIEQSDYQNIYNHYKTKFGNFILEYQNKKYVHFEHSNSNMHGINLSSDFVVTEFSIDPHKNYSQKCSISPIFSLKYFMNNSINFHQELESIIFKMRIEDLYLRNNKLAHIKKFSDDLVSALNITTKKYIELAKNNISQLQSLQGMELCDYKLNANVSLNSDIINICGLVDDIPDLGKFCDNINIINNELNRRLSQK